MMEPTYVFKNGKVYTVSGGKVVASVKESDFESKTAAPSDFMEDIDSSLDPEEDIALPDPPDDLQEEMLEDVVDCPACGAPSSASDSFCGKCGEPLAEGGPLEGDFGGDLPITDELGLEDDMLGGRMVAKVASPNGLDGRVMSRTPSLWGEEVTVRFANGNIKRMAVTEDMTFTTERAASGESPVESLNERLASSVAGDRASLQDRKEELAAIQHEASSLMAKASHGDQKAMDDIAKAAFFEGKQVDEALEHIASEEVEGFIPTAPFEYRAGAQADLGRHTDGEWLNEVVGDMRSEARSTDFGKLMEEGPEIFMAQADSSVVADAGSTRRAATRYVRQFTASSVTQTTDEQRAQFETHFLSRVEGCRRSELASLKQSARKEAKSNESSDDTSDDALYL